MNFRDKALSEVPKWYNPYLHLILPPVIGLSIILFCVLQLSSVTVFEVIFGGLFLFGMFGIEWFIHRNILHAKFPLLSYLYRMHILHHGLYNHETMQLKDKKEFYYILIPIYAIFLVFLGLIPFSLLFGLLGTNLHYITMIVGVSFFIIYEFLHLSYHMPVDHYLYRVVQKLGLAKLHTSHHNLDYMKKYNFNVTFPVFDRIMKTYRGE